MSRFLACTSPHYTSDVQGCRLFSLWSQFFGLVSRCHHGIVRPLLLLHLLCMRGTRFVCMPFLSHITISEGSWLGFCVVVFIDGWCHTLGKAHPLSTVLLSFVLSSSIGLALCACATLCVLPSTIVTLHSGGDSFSSYRAIFWLFPRRLSCRYYGYSTTTSPFTNKPQQQHHHQPISSTTTPASLPACLPATIPCPQLPLLHLYCYIIKSFSIILGDLDGVHNLLARLG